MKKHLTFSYQIAVLFILTICLMLPVTAIANEHYGIGGEGLKAASLPGPGFNYLMYNNYYTASKTMDKNGNDAGIGFDIGVIANVNRFVYMTEKKILGADFGVHLLVPLVKANLEIGAFHVDEDKSGLGDIVVEPLLLSWHKEKFDAVLGLAAFIPVGKYDKNDNVNIGQDHYTLMLSQGVTYYINDKKDWHAAYLARYEKHFSNKDLDITFGDDFHIEWGIGKTINHLYDIGLVGYSHWQVTEDSGSDATWDKSVKDEVHAIGVEIGGFIPAGHFAIKGKFYQEFRVKDRPEGRSFFVNIIKPF